MAIKSYSYSSYLNKVDSTNNELSIFFGGREENIAKGYKHGPYAHDFYDILFVKSGAFDLHYGNKCICVTEGNLLIIPPHLIVEKHFTGENTATIYIAVKGDGFKQISDDLGFSKNKLVFPHAIPKDCIQYLEDIIDLLSVRNNLSMDTSTSVKIPQIISTPLQNATERRMRRKGLFYLLISELIRIHGEQSIDKKNESPQAEYINRAIKYIESNYMYDINVEAVATQIGITRNYLHSLFKKELGISVRDFIMRTRMNAACNLLQYHELPINAVAESVGYETVAFSHAFKNFTGVSALKYRNKKRKN